MRIPAWLFILGILGLIGSTVICAAFAYATTREAAISASEMGIDVGAVSFDVFAEGRPTLTPSPTIAPTLTPSVTPEVPDTAASVDVEATADASEPTATFDPLADLPELDDPSRKTILLMGIDERTAVKMDNAYRSDTMILVHVNPAAGYVGMVSIPRDLFVSIPGIARNYKINTANYLGDLNEYPGGGGPALAAETIRQNFGIRVDNYIRINFDVFETVVNTLAPDGIEVCPQQEIYDPKYPDAGYGTIEVRFEAGCQRLDATRLLQYARTRATEGGDFDRARRQQEVLKAAQRELLSVGGIANFITQIPALYDTIANNIKTDLTLEDLIALGRFASGLDPDDIESGVIDNRHILGFGKNAEGEDVLLPDWIAIRRLINSVFNPEPDLTLAELADRARLENASIVVYNNTDITGLATRTGEWLASRQIIVGTPGNMPEPNNQPTFIRDYTGKTWTARYLAELLGLGADAIVPGNDGITSADVMIVIGPDIQTTLGGETSTEATPSQ